MTKVLTKPTGFCRVHLYNVNDLLMECKGVTEAGTGPTITVQADAAIAADMLYAACKVYGVSHHAEMILGLLMDHELIGRLGCTDFAKEAIANTKEAGA